jgi:polar amino acid transport system substrate-binding protein
MIMKILPLISLSLVILYGLSGHVFAEEQNNNSALDMIKKQGAISICADPNNMPFSSSSPEPRGFEIEIAQQIAAELGVTLKYDWYVQNRGFRAIRQITKDKCDIFMGLPAVKDFIESKRKLLFGEPYYSGGFALVVHADSGIKSFSDLKGNEVGVQMGTLPDQRFSSEGIERKLYRNPAAALDAMKSGEIKAAVLTSAIAAWLVNENKGGSIKIIEESRPDFIYPMAFVVRAGENDLLEAIQQQINTMKKDGRLENIFNKYGVINLNAEQKIGTSSQSASMEDIEKGRKTYKQACYKCHGPKGVSGGTMPDVRYYTGNDLEFLELVRNGRKTMPGWKSILSDEKIKQIRAYIVRLPKESK